MLLYDDPATSPAKALWFAQAIQLFQSPQPQAMLDRIVGAMFGRGMVSAYFASDEFKPARYFAQWGSFTLVLMAGADRNQHWTRTTTGYFAGPFTSITQPENTYISDLARLAAQDLVAWKANRIDHLYVAGHSMGGMICARIPEQLGAAGYQGNYAEVHDFGSARIGGSALNNRIAQFCTRTRWMLDTDPVPLAPPRVLDAPLLAAFYGPLTSLCIASYVQCAGGKVIHPLTSRIENTDLPPSQWGATTDLAAYLFTQEGELGEHAIVSYVQGLLNYQTGVNAAPPGQLTPPAAPAPQEQPAEAPPRNVTAVQRAAEAQVFDQAQRQNQAQLVIPTALACTVRRNGRIWEVVFGDRVIALGPRRRRADAIKNNLNHFLERMQSAGLVDPATFLSQMEIYLTLATDPTSGITPTMATSLPAPTG